MRVGRTGSPSTRPGRAASTRPRASSGPPDDYFETAAALQAVDGAAFYDSEEELERLSGR